MKYDVAAFNGCTAIRQSRKESSAWKCFISYENNFSRLLSRNRKNYVIILQEKLSRWRNKMIDTEDLRNSILSRLHTETCKIQSEYHSHSIENLYFDGNTYGIAACTLRGYWGLFSKIPQNFCGTVFIPEPFISIPVPFRQQISTVSADNGIAALSIHHKNPIRYPFQYIDGKRIPYMANIRLQKPSPAVKQITLSFLKKQGWSTARLTIILTSGIPIYQ